MSNVVIKLGGAIFEDPAQLDAIAGSIRAFLKDDISVTVIHGGGPQATTMSKRLGIEPNIVGGRRITDAETLEVCKMIYAGKLNVDLVGHLRKFDIPAVGVSGVSGLIHAEKRPPRVVSGGGDEPIDFGHVGDITGVNEWMLQMFHKNEFVPVVNTLGADDEGNAFNINADIAATRVANALAATHLALLTGNVPGVLEDKDDPETRIPSLTVEEARQAIDDGTIQGGMIPKIEESLEVLSLNVGAIHILGTLKPGDLERAFESPGEVGTALVP